MIWAFLGIVGIAFATLMWLSAKIGDAVRGDAAKEALDDVANANKPVDANERGVLRGKYRRS